MQVILSWENKWQGLSYCSPPQPGMAYPWHSYQNHTSPTQQEPEPSKQAWLKVVESHSSHSYSFLGHCSKTRICQWISSLPGNKEEETGPSPIQAGQCLPSGTLCELLLWTPQKILPAGISMEAILNSHAKLGKIMLVCRTSAQEILSIKKVPVWVTPQYHKANGQMFRSMGIQALALTRQ